MSGKSGLAIELRVEGLGSAELARRAAELLGECVGEPLPLTSIDTGPRHPDYSGR